MFRNRSLAFKLVVFIGISVAVVFVATFLYNYFFVKAILIRNVQENAKNLSLSLANKIEKTLWGVQQVPVNVAARLSKYDYSGEQIIQTVGDIVKNNKDIYGATISLEPYAIDSSREYFAPYAYRKKSQDLDLVMLGSDSYRYFQFDWYQMPKELGRPVWTEPFYDEGGGNVIMTTFTAPIFKENNGIRKFFGVVTADVFVNSLKDNVQSVKIYKTGYAFLVSSSGVFVSHPAGNLVMRESIFSIAEAQNSPELRNIGREMINGKQGFFLVKDFYTKQLSYLFYTPLKLNGWSVGVMIPVSELLADVRILTGQLIGIVLIGLLLLSIAVSLISRRITKPLQHLARKTTEISKGNLEVELPDIKSHDEIGNLTQSFKEMKSALKEYISNLAQTTAAKERIESELKIASAIQMGFLPKRFPPFPEKTEFDIYAKLEPAKEVGGDLYDFFLLGDEQLFFAIGDVSDKGVPAALFMAVTKTLMKGITELGMMPSEILEKVNRELCRDNESSMFVTMFCGVLNYKTGEVVYSNAGHNPPILLRNNQQPTWLDIPSGMVLGGFEDVKYECRNIKLSAGDDLLLYTDGVTEAADRDFNMYSELRLLERAKMIQGKTAELMVKDLVRSVREFAGGAPQSDDITVLALRYRGLVKKENIYGN